MMEVVTNKVAVENETFCLRWNHFEDNLLHVFRSHLKEKKFVDVTLVCTSKEDEDLDSILGHQSLFFKAHKILLSACSPFFQTVLKDNPCQHPVIILPREISQSDFHYILEYIYCGQVELPKSCLNSVLRAAYSLRIKGICTRNDDDEEEEESRSRSSHKRKSLPMYHYVKDKRQLTDLEEGGGGGSSSSVASEEVVTEGGLDSDDQESQSQILVVDEEEDKSTTDQQQPPSARPVRTYTKEDMNMALEALRERKLSLTRASEVYKIPATTLWQRANRLGIATPKKEAANKTWSDDDLSCALEALRRKEISANKAAKIYGIPSSTLYKIARKERIELAQPFNAVATTWSQADLSKALESIRNGTPVQKAASDNGIPSGTLYGRCKKVGIELSKASTAHWSEEDMNKALDSVRAGGMSINQAAIHHNLPYSSLYGRINKLKKDNEVDWQTFNHPEDLAHNSTEDYQSHPDLAALASFIHIPYSG